MKARADMAKGETCRNNYDKAFQLIKNGESRLTYRLLIA